MEANLFPPGCFIVPHEFAYKVMPRLSGSAWKLFYWILLQTGPDEPAELDMGLLEGSGVALQYLPAALSELMEFKLDGQPWPLIVGTRGRFKFPIDYSLSSEAVRLLRYTYLRTFPPQGEKPVL